MRLSDFILANTETILQEWEDFARTLVAPSQREDRILLRNDVQKMLQAIAADIASPQTARAQAAKSKGDEDPPSEAETAAEMHGAQRLESGFSLDEAISEYRALRASVTRLWEEALISKPTATVVIADFIRLNEAIDQAITESVASYSLEKEQKTRVFNAILSSSPDLSYTVNLDGTFAYANKALTDLLDLPLNEIVGTRFYLDMASAADLARQVQRVIHTKEKFRGELPYVAKSGQKSFYDYILVPVLNKQGAVEAVAGTARDITERKIAEEKNWQRANYDLVTGLPNRRLFSDRLEQDLIHARRISVPLALLFIDLDEFKEANDTFGHDSGDILLRLAATRIRSCVRETDTVARLGGDEFTVILQDLAKPADAEIVAVKILKDLANPFQIANASIQISASIGLAFSTKDVASAEDLLRNADSAMYAAKSAGRNRFLTFSAAEQNVRSKAS